jgi:hypothetical protein
MENMLSLTVLINLILTGIIGLGLLFENFNRSTLRSKLESEGTDVTARTEIESHEVVPTEVSSEPESTDKQEDQKVIKCPKCSKFIRIKTTKRPIQIACPHCGVKGELR